LKIDIISIKNCNTFSVAPSIINENAKKCALPFTKFLVVIKMTEFLPIINNEAYKGFWGQ
jgi:hypothetical protein